MRSVVAFGESNLETSINFFKKYFTDRSRDYIRDFFFFLSFCTSVYTFLSENTDDVFILNNLALVEPAIWKGDVS